MQEFGHIKVNLPEEEEEVFVVGTKAPAPVPAEAPEVPDVVEIVDLVEPAPEPAPARKSAAQDGYVVSREDLETPPMSLLQKIFIGLAVVAIIAAVVYFAVPLS